MCVQLSSSSCDSSLSTAIETRNYQNIQTEAYSHIFDTNVWPHLREELSSICTTSKLMHTISPDRPYAHNSLVNCLWLGDPPN